MLKTPLLLCFIAVVLSCSSKKETAPVEPIQLSAQLLRPSKEAIHHNGKVKKATRLKSVYSPLSIDSLDLPLVNATMVEALLHQKELLQQIKKTKKYDIAGLNVTNEKLEQTVNMLLSWQYTKPLNLQTQWKAHQLWGEDKQGSIKFTGYYTPVIRVDRNENLRYPYPIYKRPTNWQGRLPSRTQIDQEQVLAPFDLEIAYAQSKVDIYFMQLQGSGIVQYPNGALSYFGFDGTNRHAFRSVGAYLARNKQYGIRDISVGGIKRFFRTNPEMIDSLLAINPSYTFFKPKDSLPQGAGGVPLTAFYSVAVDQRYIPLGSCLLAALPVKDKDNKVIRHDYHYLLAQDVGGAIRGAGHIDLYTGIGENAQKAASDLYHYGKVWLILPNNKVSTLENQLETQPIL